MLDDEFEEKYIIEARQDKLMSLLPHNNFKHNMACEKTICKPKFIEIATTLTSRDRGITNFQGEGTAIISNKIKCLGHIKDTNYQSNRFYDDNGISPTLATTGSPKIIQLGNYIPSKTAIVIDKSIKKSVADNFKLQLNEIQRTDKDIFQAECEGGWQDNKIGIRTSQTIRANNNFHPCLDNNYVIRKLTPLECWRLMGFNDDEFNKAKDSGVSNSQLYKQAGNSIVVNVLEKIFQNIFINKSEKINNNRIKKLSLKDLF